MNDENEIETRMHCVIRLFKNENEVRIYHYTRKLSKALFYEQLYPHIFQQNENDKITLNNLTQRSEINSIYTNYNGHTNTTRRSSNRYNQYTPKYINNSNKNSIEFDPIQKLGIKTKNVNVIQEEKDENENENDFIIHDDNYNNNNSQQQLITPMPEPSGLEVIKSGNSMEFAKFKSNDNNNNDTPIDTNNIEIIKLHDTQNSNTFVINNNNINTPKNNNNNNIGTPTFEYGNSDESNNTKHKMDFSIDSLSNITAVDINQNNGNTIIPSLQTPSTSNVHVNYFDTAPTASALINANKSKYHFIAMPSSVNKKTSVKSGTKLVSSKVSKLNNVKMKTSNNNVID
eukprot:440270_1